ncbi:TetR/AcrR family transcriptional regulator [Pseudoclavibacter terrae]
MLRSGSVTSLEHISVPPRTGRPSAVRAADVLEAALAIWTTEGYHQTGWREISDATGLSIRTLIRHFHTRADVLMHGVPESTARFRNALAAIPESAPLHGALRVGVMDSLPHDPLHMSLAARSSRLVDSVPELSAAAHRAYVPWRELIVSRASACMPDAPGAVHQAIASAYQTATLTALAESELKVSEGAQRASVEVALSWLDPNRLSSSSDC